MTRLYDWVLRVGVLVLCATGAVVYVLTGPRLAPRIRLVVELATHETMLLFDIANSQARTADVPPRP